MIPGAISGLILGWFLWVKACEHSLSKVQKMHVPSFSKKEKRGSYSVTFELRKEELSVGLGQFLGLVFIGVVANSMFSFWSENGLHVVSMGSVLITLWCLNTGQPIVLVYPGTFLTVLGADLYVARNHPDFPAGIGGAGFSDALFVFPILFTGLAIFAWYLINKQKDLSY